ncbi:hypothetical protein [Microcella sp.]|uniref:hypothetical protein n=1 Tax=Microcella sp. TaxID=1913979 RepID=UPI00256CE3A6|nr:hypothetical protein [Microcella sp.]MBX9470377.1 hypothetical protein [Microcella sp.]
MLDTVERASRVLATSSVSGIWTNHVFELTQVLPRLLLELNRRDQAIAVWVYREIQQVVLAKDRRQSARIIQGIGYTLAEWKNGRKSRAWFAKDLVSNPPVDPFVVPKSTHVKLNTRPLLTLLTLPVFAGFAFGIGHRASAFVANERSSTWGSLTKVKA